MKLDRKWLEPVFKDDFANAIKVYCGENISTGNILALKGTQGAFYKAFKADPTDPTLSTATIMGVASYAGALGDHEGLFLQMKRVEGLDTSLRTLGDRVFLAAGGTYAYVGTIPVGFVSKVDATDGHIVLCPALVEGVAASQVLISDAGNFWTTDTDQGVADETAAAIGGTNSTTRPYTDDAVVTDDEPLVSSINALDQTFEDKAEMAWDQAALPTSGIAKGYVLGTGNELLVEAQAVPDNTVQIALGGKGWSALGHKRSSAAVPIVGPINVPAGAGETRHDIIVLTNGGAIAIRAGAEGAPPQVDPALVAGDIPLARVTQTQGADVDVQTANITDLRPRQGVVQGDKVLYDDAAGYYTPPTTPDTKLTVGETLDQIGQALWALTPASTFRWFDDFVYQNGFTEADSMWQLHGDTNDPAVPATNLEGGIVECITAAGAGDRSQAVGSTPIQLGRAGALAEFRFKVDDITDVAFFLGLTDNPAIENPCEVTAASDNLAANADDLLGIVFDSDGTTQRIHAAAFDSTVGDAGNALFPTAAPVNDTWLRVVLLSDDSGENLTFRMFDETNTLIEEIQMTGDVGCGEAVDLYPTFIVEARGAAARTLTVDWSLGVAGRAS